MSSFWDENKGTFKKAGIAAAKGLGKGAKVTAKYGYSASKTAYNNHNGRTPQADDAEEKSEEHFEVRKLSNLPDPKSFPMPPKRNVGPGISPSGSPSVVTPVSASPGIQSSVRPQPPPPPPRSVSPVNSTSSLPRYERTVPRASISPRPSMADPLPQPISMMDNSQSDLEPPLPARGSESRIEGAPSPRPKMALPVESQSLVEMQGEPSPPNSAEAPISAFPPPPAKPVPHREVSHRPTESHVSSEPPYTKPPSLNPTFPPAPTRSANVKPLHSRTTSAMSTNMDSSALTNPSFKPPPTRTVPLSREPFADLDNVPSNPLDKSPLETPVKKAPPPKSIKKAPPPKPSKKPTLSRELSDLTPVAPSPINFAQEISNLRLNSPSSQTPPEESPHPSPATHKPKPPVKPSPARKPSNLISSPRVSPRNSPRPPLPPSRKSRSQYDHLDLRIDTLWFTSNDLQSLPPDLQGLTCVASVAKAGQHITKKFGFRGKDLSTIRLTIQWDEADPRTSVSVSSEVIAPSQPSLKQIIEGNNKYGDHIASWCENKEGAQVGDGECWTLARDALAKGCGKHAFITDHLNHGYLLYTIEAVNEGVVKQRSNPTDVIKRGDILQFKSCVFSSDGVTSYYGSPDHTSVVTRKLDHDGNKVQVVHQNAGGVKKVTESVLNLDTLVKGQVKVFRAMDSDWLVDLHL